MALTVSEFGQSFTITALAQGSLTTAPGDAGYFPVNTEGFITNLYVVYSGISGGSILLILGAGARSLFIGSVGATNGTRSADISVVFKKPKRFNGLSVITVAAAGGLVDLNIEGWLARPLA